MKRPTLLFLLFLGVNSTSFSQTQISHFDNQVPALEYVQGGLINIDSIDYFIETSENSLRLSTISDTVQMLYEVFDFPANDQINYYYGRMKTRSGYIVDSIYLYEIFGSQIRKRNLLTSEIEEIYSFSNDEISSIRNMEIVGNIIHFESSEFDHLSFFNIITQEYTNLPYTLRTAYREGNHYYYKQDQFALVEFGLTKLNAENGSIKKLFEDEHLFYLGTNSNLNGQRGLIFGKFEKMRFFNRDTSYLVNCEFDVPFSLEVNVHESNDHYIIISNIFSELTFQVIDKSNCTNIITETFQSDFDAIIPLKIFTSQSFSEDYLLFAKDYNSYFDTQILLYDKNTLTLSLIDDKIMAIDENSFYRIDEELYFIGREPYFDYPEKSLFSLNLTTNELKINQETLPFSAPISFGYPEKDSTFLLAKNSQFVLNLYRFYSGSNVTKIFKPIDTRNGGQTSTRYLATDKEKLVFKFNNEIFYANNSSNKVDKIVKITEAQDISELVIEEGVLKGLINNNDNSYFLNYQFDNDLLTTTQFAEFIDLDASSFALSKYIFGKFSTTKKIYFDLESESFIPIPIPEDIISMYRSNQHILFLKVCSEGYCLTSFNKGEIIDVQLNFESEPEIFSNKNGQFLIQENISDVEKKISLLNDDGALGDQIDVSGSKVFKNQQGIENGPLASLMFYNQETGNLEILLHRYNDFHSYKIPYHNAENANIIWYKAGNSIVIKSEDSEEEGIYICTLGENLKKLEFNDIGFEAYNLLFASHRDGIITCIVDSNINGLEFVSYIIESDSITITQSDFEDLNFNYRQELRSTQIQISHNTYYITFPHYSNSASIEKSNFYSINVDDLTFQLLLNSEIINQRGNPHSFIESYNFHNFIARSSVDYSYQLFSIQKDEITSIINTDKNLKQVAFYPNPSTNFISIGINIDILKIYNSQGIEIKTMKNYSANDKIDISDLKIGLYYLDVEFSNTKLSSSFIKI